jgi:hypothetical protein
MNRNTLLMSSKPAFCAAFEGRRVIVGLVAAILVCAPYSAFGQASIGLNFIAGFGGNDGASVTGSAGVVAQSNWNNVGPTTASPTAGAGGNGVLDAIGTANDLLDSNGVATTVDVTWQADNTWAAAGGNVTNDDQRLMDGYLDNSQSLDETRVEFQQIPYPTYDVIVYFGSDGNGRSGAIQLNDDFTTQVWYQTSTGGGSFAGPSSYSRASAAREDLATPANYAFYAGVQGSELSIQVLRGSNNSGIHGIQIVQSVTASVLQVNTVTGEIKVVGGDQIPVDINGYEIRTANASLIPDRLNSLESQRIDAVDAALDNDNVPGSSPGETWQVVHADSTLVVEGFLFGESRFDLDRSVSLGRIYDVSQGEDPTLSFAYSLASGVTVQGRVEFVQTAAPTADFDGDGFVGGSDLLAWQRGFGTASGAGRSDGDADADGDVDRVDFEVWEEQLGAAVGAATVFAVPEPTCCWLPVAILGLLLRSRQQRAR